jgi:hypothetical protein
MKRDAGSLLLLSSVCVLAACGSSSSSEELGRAGEALSCAGLPNYVAGTSYAAGAQVQNIGNGYQCKPWPYNGWCGQAGYEPGVGFAWTDAWTQLGACDSGADAGSDAKADAPADAGSDAKVDATDSGSKADGSDGGTDTGADAGPLTARTVFGHTDFKGAVPNEVVANKAFNPQGVVVDKSTSPNRVYVFDSSNMRILGFSSLGTCSGGTSPGKACTNNLDCPGSGASCAITGTKAADLIFGQKDATSATCNGDNTQSLAASASTLCSQVYPRAISLLESPEPASMAIDAQHNLYVPDKWNHRVVKYNDPFANNDVVADFVWGQPDFAQRLCNQGLSAPTASTLCLNSETTGVHVTGNEEGAGVEVDPSGNLWVADVGNNRVLRFPPNSATANLVLGQPNFASNAQSSECALGAASTGQNLCWPKLVRYDAKNNRLFVIDWRGDTDLSGDFRVLIYNKPTSGDFTNQMPATETLVGKDMGDANRGKVQPTEPDWRRIEGLEFPGDYMTNPANANSFWLSDSKHSRVLYYTKASGSWQAKKVLGQGNLTDVYLPGFTSPGTYNCAGGLSSDQCYAGAPAGSMGVDSANNIYLAEVDNQRVMRYAGNPADAPTGASTGTAPAANAILFPVPSNTTINVNQIGGHGLYSPNNVLLVKYPSGTTPSSQMIVFDQFRALFWNGYDTKTSGSVADGVLYQPDLATHSDTGTGVLHGIAANSTGSKIFVGASGHIDVFAGPLTTNKQPFATISGNINFRLGGSTGAINVQGLAYDEANDVLWIGDNWNANGGGSRVLRVTSPLSNPVINLVLGQPSATSVKPNRGLDTPSGTNNLACPSRQADSFGWMTAIRLDTKGNLYVVDATHEGWQCSNNRVLEFDAATLVPASNQDFFCGVADAGCTTPRRAKRVYGPADFTSLDMNENGPTDTPNTPISVSFDAQNHMLMTVDGYGNPQGKRVFFYKDPVPTCSSSGCAVASTKIFPMLSSQPTDSYWDPSGNVVVMDQTWTRVLFFAGADVSTWISAP